MKTITFYSQAHIAKKSESLTTYTSKAAQEDVLKDIRNLLPAEEEIKANPDLLFFAANAAVANLVNLNGAGMTTETALKIKESWLRKPVNISHDRSRCIGFITGSSFSTYGENKLITSEEAAALAGPFNMAISGILWRIAGYGYEADMIESCDNPDQDYYHDLSISWEIGYSEYIIALGTKNLQKATIISDPDEIVKYSKYLREEGGDGFTEEGEEVYMIIAGDPIVLGVGAVRNPAASVKGIVTTPNKILDSASISDVKAENTQISAEIKPNLENNAEKNKKSEKNLSQNKKTTVKKNKIMKKFNSVDEFHECLAEAGVDVSTQRAFDSYLTEQVGKGAKAYTEEIQAKETEIASVKQEALATKEKLSNAETELETLKTQLSELKDQLEQDRKQNVLASRLDSLAETYELSDAVKKAITKQIRELDDASFASWLKPDEMGGVLLAGREKDKTVDIDAVTESLKTATASVNIPNAQNLENEKPDYTKLIESIKLN